MSVLGCGNRIPCVIGAFIASVIVGVAAAFLSFAAIITVTPVFYWVTLGIAVVFLAIYLIISGQIKRNLSCSDYCAKITSVLIGILGSILSSLILLAVSPAAISILGAILIGFLIFFLSLLFTSTACLINCGYDCE
jgi:hypothetical protein